MTTYASASDDLVAAVDRVVENWLVRIAQERLTQHFGDVPTDLREAVKQAAHEGRMRTVERLAQVLRADVDAQQANPLQILRQSVVHVATVLRKAGVPEVLRDEFDASINPGDVYSLYPAHWSDVDESLTEPGIVWGAAKAATVLQRRRAEGKLDPT